MIKTTPFGAAVPFLCFCLQTYDRHIYLLTSVLFKPNKMYTMQVSRLLVVC